MSNNLSDYFSKDGLSFRPTLEEDVDKLVDIINEAYSYQDVVKGEPRTNPEHLRKRVVETDFYTLLQNDEVIGCVYLESKFPNLHFGLLTLAPHFRGKGIGEAIMSAINKYARDNNFTAIDLDYMSLAPWLKTYYEKHGFVETGDVVKWGTIDLINMRKELGG